MRPQGVSRSIVHWSRGTHSSGVRFWNFTASAPASTAPSIIRLASLERAVVVDADLGDHEDRVSLAHPLVADANGTRRIRSAVNVMGFPSSRLGASSDRTRRTRGRRRGRPGGAHGTCTVRATPGWASAGAASKPCGRSAASPAGRSGRHRCRPPRPASRPSCSSIAGSSAALSRTPANTRHAQLLRPALHDGRMLAGHDGGLDAGLAQALDAHAVAAARSAASPRRRPSSRRRRRSARRRSR